MTSYIIEGSKVDISLKISLSGTKLIVVPLFFEILPKHMSFVKGIPFEYY